MKNFYLMRFEDVSGISGTGVIAYGTQFVDGQCVTWWPNFGSICVYKSIQAVEDIHGHGGKTKVVFETS